ncbi:MAG TPA: hypothetical protein VMF11_15160 [Candidatus Baltobacteraceae bacterium]|nr:hypothetical protein [Candidatus Baltobacteraceae bacterium]
MLAQLSRHFGVDRAGLCLRLKPHIPTIRAGFDAAEVEIAYDDQDVIATYLLLYYANYTAAGCDALARIQGLLPARDLSAVFFCGGSLPELLATAFSMNRANVGPKVLNASVFDQYVEAWAWTHQITTALVGLFAPEVVLELQSGAVDLRRRGQGVPQTVANADLVVFQHCLNEFADSPGAIECIERIGRAAPRDTVFLFLDQGKYRTVTRSMLSIRERFVAADYQVLEDCHTPYTYEPPDFFLPDELKSQFFDGIAARDEQGRWTPGHRRARTLNLRALCMRKRR